ncbi:MAG TPA: Ig-like domain-containing protein, partial [Asanoa sp.]
VAGQTDLADGTYTAVAQQQDTGGRTGASAPSTFTVDTSAPVVTLSGPADGALLGDSTPTFSGDAGNQTGDAQTVTVRVYAGTSATGTPVQTRQATRTGTSWTVDASPALADGTYTAQAEQQDAAGNTATSAAHSFTIDATGPNVTLTTPADGSTLGTGNATFSGAAGDGPGDAEAVSVNVYSGTAATGTPVQTRQATRSGTSWTVDASPALADGTYTAQAEQQDATGNTATSAAHTFTVNTAAPVVTLTAPADGSSTADATPAFAGSASDRPIDSQTVTVTVYEGASAGGTVAQTLGTTRSGGSWSVSGLIDLADGTYTAVAQQQDTGGRTGASAPSTFTVDTSAPVVTLSGPADGALVGDSTPTFSGDAGNQTGDAQTVTVKVYAGTGVSGSPVQTRQATRSGGSWSVPASPALADGTYTAQAEQQDAAGNTATSAAHSFTIDTTAPAVTLTAPAAGSVSTTATPTFSGAAGNQTGDAQTVTVNVYSGTAATGTPVQTRQATRTGTSWTVDASPALADGTYTAQAEQQDAAGNTGKSTPATTFSINTAAPPSAYAEQILSDSPRAYWRLGEASGTTADDATPNGNAGGYSGGPQLGQPGAIAGDPNKAVTFDGVDDHMLAPDTNSLDVTAGSTVEAWVKRSKNLQYQVIVGKPGNGQSKFENYALWLNSSNQPAAYFGDGTTYASVTSSTPIDTNWHHLVATYDNQAARLYIDGALSKSVGSTVQLTPNASPLNLARSGADNTYRFGGQLDEVAVYGTALSATRIRAHYDTAIGSDTVGPDVTLTSPADGSRSDTGNVTFGGAAGNAPGDSPTVTVKVYSGQAATGTPVQTRQATRSGSSWTVDASPALANGTYTARAEQGDTAGNTGFSAPTTFTVGPPPPPPGPSPYRDEVMSDSPRAFWRLGETSGTSAIDETANHNNGTYAQGVQLGVPGAIGGESNGAASFDGIDDYMGVPDTPSLDLTTGATVEAWVKRSKGANWQVLVGKPGNGQTRLENYALWLNSSDFLVGYFGNGTAYAQVESTGPLNTNWHHVVVTYNNQTARLYIDGVLNNSTTSTVSLTANALPLHLARASDNSFLFGGRLDEVAVYGTALTAARVQAHYQTGLGTDTTPPDVTLTTPEAGSQTTDTTPAFAGMAAVTGTDSSTVTVKVYSGSSATGTPVRTMTTTRAPIGTWNVSAATALGAGTYTVQAEQQDTAGNVGRSAASTFTIGSRQPLGTGAEFIGAGDIAYCDDTGDEATAALLDQFASATVFTLGDNAYESGTTQEFNNCYQPSWGRAKARTRPSLGDHDYADGADPNGTGYFAYFATQLAPFGASATDPNRGYYSYDLGSWHVVVLNAVCGGAASGCNVATQIAWLRSDLAAHPASCTAALMSAPRYSSGSVHGNNTSMQNYWSELAQAGVEFVMSGDDHDYERFAPMDVAGQVDPNGMRQLVIGTGGRSLYPLVPAGIVKANSEVREDSTYGILRLVLRTGAYEWEFIPQAGKSFVDSGSDTCH